MQAKESSATPTPLADTLRVAESYFQLQQELEKCLREGFVAISGNRLATRPGAYLMNPETWPSASSARILVDSQAVELLPDNGKDEQVESSIRQWNGGFAPSTDLQKARDAFKAALEISIRLVRLSKDVESYTVSS